jgi:hypothetical protein
MRMTFICDFGYIVDKDSMRRLIHLGMEERVLSLGRCNYVELIDTIFTDVEGVD